MREHTAAGTVATDKTLVRDHGTIDYRGIYRDIKSNGCHVIGCRIGICPHETSRGIFRCIDQQASLQSRNTCRGIGNRCAIQGGTACYIAGIGRYLVSQQGVDAIFLTGVFNGDGIAQGITLLQNRGIASDIRGGFLYLECRR